MRDTFVILVAGAFSGRRGEPPRAHEIDRDTFDEVLRTIAPSLELGLPYCSTLEFSCADDFRPDSLVERVPVLRTLMEARGAVGDPERMAQLLAQADTAVPDPAVAPAAPADSVPPPASPPIDEAALLDDLLEDKSPPPARGPAATSLSALDRRIQEIIAASVDRTDYAAQALRRDAIDEEISARVRAILRHSAFRRLEASWIPLRRLVRLAETGEDFRIRIIDRPPEDVVAMGETIVESFDLLVTDWILGSGPDDLRALEMLADLAARSHAPILAAVDATSAVGAPWDALREHPGAHRLGLCAPRILLRLPYGRDTDPVEPFDFEEGSRTEDPDSYAWESPTFSLAGAVATAWSAHHSLAGLDQFLEVERLPQHVYREADEIKSRPPVEIELPDSRVDEWRAHGLIPVTGASGRDTARIRSLRALSGEPLFADLMPSVG